MRWSTKTCFAASLSLLTVATVANAATSKSKFEVRNQLGTPMGHSGGQAAFSKIITNRFLLDLEQQMIFSDDFRLVAGGRATVETIESGKVGTGDSIERNEADFNRIEPRDLYLQFGSGSLVAKFGYQQVVWGEAFGFFFADLINPKDLRNATLTGLFEQADLRQTIPIANLKWMSSSTSAQLIYAPFASHHLLPSPGGAFFPIRGAIAIPPENIRIRSSNSTDDTPGDYGMRLAHQIDSLDLSVFGLSYLDRIPYYKILTFTPPNSLTLEERQKRVNSYGATATLSAGDWLIRSEFISTQERRLTTFSGTTLGSELYNEMVFVLGIDPPAINGWTSSLQASTSLLDKDTRPLFRVRDETTIGLRLAKEIQNRHNLESFFFIDPADSSSLATFRWTYASSPRFEYRLGIESMQGSQNSRFGVLAQASRIMIGLRGVFDGPKPSGTQTKGR